MAPLSHKNLDFAVLMPGVGVFGGVRRFLEIGNELVRRGHRYVIYHPKGDPPGWLPFLGDVKPTSDFAKARHQILICNDPPLLGTFAEARADLKLFYFALEKIRGERDIARHPEWTILANSTGMHDRLLRKHGIRAEKVIGGISLETFKPPSGPKVNRDTYRVMAFGRLSRGKKGVPIVLRTVEAFARSIGSDASGGRPVQLVLFDHLGPDNERDPRTDIRCPVPYEFHINLSQSELAELYGSCDVFVSAEKKAGWANTVAESMACGLPVVCTPAGTRDIALHKNTAWVVRWRHPFFLGRGLRGLYNNPAMANGLSDNALERIRHYSWPHVVDQLEEVVRRHLGDRGIVV